MKLNPNEIYHVYNRGNNKQQIFLEKENYNYFLGKVKLFIAPYCDILAYVLMPNHFHFLIHANEFTNQKYRRINLPPRKKRTKPIVKMTLFAYGMQQLLSSYTKGINKKYNRTGSLFQQNTKSKKTSSDSLMDDYSLWCFVYIHNNPKSAGLVHCPEEYEFSSCKDYLNQISDSICNQDLAKRLLSFDQNNLFEFKEMEISNEAIKRIFK